MMLGSYYCGDAAGFLPLLADAGAAINRATDNEKRATALHMAVKAGRVRCVDVLMELGADPAIANGDGKTALDLARAHANHKTRRTLLAALTLPPSRSRR